MHWEELKSGTMGVWRAKVPGGWMVFVRHSGEEAGAFFYPDINHQWNGKTL
jgi:hypothetical protein